jgi:hypothetical protein
MISSELRERWSICFTASIFGKNFRRDSFSGTILPIGVGLSSTIGTHRPFEKIERCAVNAKARVLKSPRAIG